ncbi:MAG: hypothetical protein PHF51_01605 [Candidatus ainarchaeum sp.]|nr:hypothetical protein [Candidatus ainarchaeum sp.]
MAAAAAFLLVCVLASGCIIPGPGPTPTPVPTVVPTATPSPTPPATPSPSPTPTPSPTPEEPPTPIQCPGYCLYGCEPGTTNCKNPVCSPNCLNGCEPGTTKCRVISENIPMNNTDFETGTYAGWDTYGNAFTEFMGHEFNRGGPKDMILSNSGYDINVTVLDNNGTGPGYVNQTRHVPGAYYEEPYSGFQGRYAASGYPDRRTTGGLVSRRFNITMDHLSFLAIGAEDREMCVGLKIADTNFDGSCATMQNDPSTVRYFTPNSLIAPFARFTRVAWDTADLKGKQGVIEVIDGSTNAYIEVDDFRQDGALVGTLVEDLVPSYYSCNHNSACEPGLGEYEQWCVDDCPHPSSCRTTSEESGLIDFTMVCHAFRLSPAGLSLSLKNSGIGANDTVILEGVKCSQEDHPDISTYAPFEARLSPGQVAVVGNGTMPCYGPDGIQLNFTPGDQFAGRIFYSYRDSVTNYNFTWHARLNFNAVAQQNR